MKMGPYNRFTSIEDVSFYMKGNGLVLARYNDKINKAQASSQRYGEIYFEYKK